MTAPTSRTSPWAASAPLTRTPQALALFALSAAGFVALAVALRFPMSDVLVYRAEGSAVWNGTDLYGFTVTEWRLPATYPPFAALLFVPVALVPLSVAKAGFALGNIALVAVLVRLSLRAAAVPGTALAAARLPLVLTVSAGALWLEPVFQTLAFGQVNLAMACLVLWDLSRPEGARGKGFVLGVAAGIKLTPALFVVYLLLTGRFRAGLTAVGGFAASVTVGVLALPGAGVEFWTRRMFETGRVGKAWIVDNQSLQGLAARLAHDPAPGPLWLVPAAVLAVGGMWLARRAYVHDMAVHDMAVHGAAVHRAAGHATAPGFRGVDFWGVQVTALVSLLVSPISWSHHWVWCVPLLIGLAVRAERTPAWRTSERWVPHHARQASHHARQDRARQDHARQDHARQALRWVSAVAVVVFAARTMWVIPRKGDLDLRLPWWQQPLAAPYPLLTLALLAVVPPLLAAARGTVPPAPRVPPARIGGDGDHPVDHSTGLTDPIGPMGSVGSVGSVGSTGCMGSRGPTESVTSRNSEGSRGSEGVEGSPAGSVTGSMGEGSPMDRPRDRPAAGPAGRRADPREHECVEARGGRCAKHDAGHPADRDPTAGARGAGAQHVPGDHLDGHDGRR
ncbi:hypothetical protein GCM10009863_40820 [Streptomyces axinellae]|uniref:DUF2029 domain-containing protein n=1 Tax=Streptomyces axinellae TaxID=552788 RepID=A0ABN3QC73_9ACTN